MSCITCEIVDNLIKQPKAYFIEHKYNCLECKNIVITTLCGGGCKNLYCTCGCLDGKLTCSC